jgi:hypothetical protein
MLGGEVVLLMILPTENRLSIITLARTAGPEYQLEFARFCNLALRANGCGFVAEIKLMCRLATLNPLMKL